MVDDDDTVGVCGGRVRQDRAWSGTCRLMNTRVGVAALPPNTKGTSCTVDGRGCVQACGTGSVDVYRGVWKVPGGGVRGGNGVLISASLSFLIEVRWTEAGDRGAGHGTGEVERERWADLAVVIATGVRCVAVRQL